MNIELKIVPELKEVSIKIEAPELTDEVRRLLKKLNQTSGKPLTGTRNQRIYILVQEDISFFFCESQKVFASCDSGVYEMRQKLYELEEQLKNTSFVRISKSVIANIKNVSHLEMSFNGSMCANFKNGSKEFVSRKYVASIKDYLSIGGK